MPIPDKFKDAPELELGLEFVFRVYQDLTFDRPTGFSTGYIPYTVIYDYLDRAGIQGQEAYEIFLTIRHADIEYVEYLNKKAEKQAKQKQNGSSNARPRRPRKLRKAIKR